MQSQLVLKTKRMFAVADFIVGYAGFGGLPKLTGSKGGTSGGDEKQSVGWIDDEHPCEKSTLLWQKR